MASLSRAILRNFASSAAGIGSQIDVCIVGGGIMGASTAYWLTKHNFNVTVIERDPTYSKCATSLAAGGFRQQFSIPMSVKMSMMGHKMVTNPSKHFTLEGESPAKISFNPVGYLFLAKTENEANIMLRDWKMQRQLGAKIDLLTLERLKARYPFMNFDDVLLATEGCSTHEGMIDPWEYLCVVKQKSIDQGANYIAADVTSISTNQDRVTGVTYHSEVLGENNLGANYMINAAGPWAGILNAMLPSDSFHVPVTPRKRYVYLLDVPSGPGDKMPMLIDSSGAWCRFERSPNHFLCGMSQSKEVDESTDHSNLDVDPDFFEENIWPALANRVPAFEQVKVLSCYSGYYEYNTVDQNGLIGIHPLYNNHMLVCGFSGHGLQHGLAAGRGISELIVHGHYTTLDLDIFSPSRLIHQEKLLHEKGII